MSEDRPNAREVRERVQNVLRDIEEIQWSGSRNEAAWGWVYDRDARDLLRVVEERDQEIISLRKATGDLLEVLHAYYWEEDDEELEMVNRLRRLLGWREQLPEAQEVELQAEEAELRQPEEEA